MRNDKLEIRNEKEQKTDSLERPSALDNKNLNSFYRIIEIILNIANLRETCFMAAR